MELSQIWHQNGKRKKHKRAKPCREHYTENYLDKAGFDGIVRSAIGDWMLHSNKRYEKDNRATREEFLQLLTEFKNNVERYGAEAVCQLVEDCISKDKKRIVWRKLANTTE